MPGFVSSISQNFDCVFASNADFSTNSNITGNQPLNPKDTNGLQNDGELWIGRTLVNTGNTHISVGNIVALDSSITVGYAAPNITLKANAGSTLVGSVGVDVFTPTGTNPVTPNPAGRITVTGAQVATGIIGANVIRTDSLTANTYTIEIQQSTTSAGIDTTKNGVAHFNNAEFTVSEGFVSLAGGTTPAVLTLTPNEDADGTVATAIQPTAGNINILGSVPSFATVTETYNSLGTSAGDLLVEHRAWLTGFVVDPSTTPGTRGTFSTIQAAVTAAVSGQTIFIRTGTYTENITLKAGVNLSAFICDAERPNVTIIGKMTATFAGTSSISGVRLQTNADNVLAITGASATVVILTLCYINATNASAFLMSSSGGSDLRIFRSRGNLGALDINYFTLTNSSYITIYYSFLENSAVSLLANTIGTGCVAQIHYSLFASPITSSGTGAFGADYSTVGSAATTLNLGGTGSNTVDHSNIGGPAGVAAITVGAGVGLVLTNSTIASQFTNAIDGTGTIAYNGLVFTGTATNISTTTQTPLLALAALPYKNVTTTPYSTIDQDQFLSVDTSALAITIRLPNAPTKYRPYYIKDRTGTANTRNITVTTVGGAVLIDGATTNVIANAYGSITVIFNGTGYEII